MRTETTAQTVNSEYQIRACVCACVCACVRGIVSDCLTFLKVRPPLSGVWHLTCVFSPVMKVAEILFRKET